ncbi:MAG TPA: hypothetical protein VE604_10550 [Candidatus Polarisedimenticolia bacterium]|nr:hypothetical protein [Candidatus Polarisedimenticolia bacterium]
MKTAVIATFRVTSQIFSTFAFLRRQKFAITIAAAAAVLAVAGCGGVGASSPSPSPTPNNPPSPTPTPSATPTPAASSVNIPTWHMDNGRSGLNSNETQLTPANVNAASFGKLFSYAVDGYAYAQPLYMSNLRINGSSHNVVLWPRKWPAFTPLTQITSATEALCGRLPCCNLERSHSLAEIPSLRRDLLQRL